MVDREEFEQRKWVERMFSWGAFSLGAFGLYVNREKIADKLLNMRMGRFTIRELFQRTRDEMVNPFDVSGISVRPYTAPSRYQPDEVVEDIIRTIESIQNVNDRMNAYLNDVKESWYNKISELRGINIRRQWKNLSKADQDLLKYLLQNNKSNEISRLLDSGLENRLINNTLQKVREILSSHNINTPSDIVRAISELDYETLIRVRQVLKSTMYESRYQLYTLYTIRKNNMVPYSEDRIMQMLKIRSRSVTSFNYELPLKIIQHAGENVYGYYSPANNIIEKSLVLKPISSKMNIREYFAVHGKPGQDMWRNLTEAVKQSGLPKELSGIVHAERQVRLLNLVNPVEFGGHLRTLIKSIYDLGKDYDILDCRLHHQTMDGYHKLIFDVKIRPRGQEKVGSFRIPIALPRHMEIRHNFHKGGRIISGAQNPTINAVQLQVEEAVRLMRSIADNAVREGIDAKPGETNRFIEQKMYNAVYGQPATGQLMDLFKAVQIGPRQNMMRVQGVLENARDAFQELLSLRNARTIQVVDFEFDVAKNGVEVSGKYIAPGTQYIHKMAIITLQREANGQYIPVQVRNIRIAGLEPERLGGDYATKMAQLMPKVSDKALHEMSQKLREEVVTPEEAVRIIESLSTGSTKIISKAARMQGGDIDAVRNFLKVFGDKQSSTLFTQPGTWIDIQRLIPLHGVRARAIKSASPYLKIESYPHLIRELIHSLPDTTRAKALQFLKQFEDKTGVNLLRPKMMHLFPGVDVALEAFYFLLQNNFNLNEIRSDEMFNDLLGCINVKNVQKFESEAFVSASLYARGVMSTANPQALIPFYHMSSPVTSKYQIQNALPVFGLNPSFINTKNKVRLVSGALFGTMQKDGGLFRKYVQPMMWLFDPVLQGESTVYSPISFSKMEFSDGASTPVVVRQVHGMLRENVTYDTINGELVVGVDKQGNPVILQAHNPKNKFRITKIVSDGKQSSIHYEEIYTMEAPKVHTIDMRGMSAKQISKSGPFQYVGFYNFFSRNDPGALIRSVMGTLQAHLDRAMEQDSGIVDRFIQLFNKQFEADGLTAKKSGSGIMIVDETNKAWNLEKSPVSTTESILKRIFGIMKTLGFTQDKLVERYYGTKQEYAQFMRHRTEAIIDRILYMLDSKDFTMRTDRGTYGFARFLELAWAPLMETVPIIQEKGSDKKRPAKNLEEIVRKLRDRDADVIKAIFQESNVASIMEAADVKFADGQSVVHAGFYGIQDTYYTTGRTFFGNEKGHIRVTPWYLVQLQYFKHGKEFVDETMRRMVSESRGRIGLWNMQQRINFGAKPWGVDIGEDIERMLKSDIARDKEIARRFLESKPISKGTPEFDNLFELPTGEIVTRDAVEADPSLATIARPLSDKELKRRTFDRKDIEYFFHLENKNQGYITLPQAVFLNENGHISRYQKLQYFGPTHGLLLMNEHGQIDPQGKIAILTEKMVLMKNMIAKIRAGENPVEEVRRYIDSLKVPIKGNLFTMMPGVQSTILYGDPYVVSQGRPKYTDATTLEFEIKINSGWLRKNSEALAKAIANADPDDIRDAVRYMRNYAETVGLTDSPIKEHPLYQLKKQSKVFQGDKTYSEFLDDILGALQKHDTRTAARMYEQGVRAGLLPVRTFGIRFPHSTMGTSGPQWAFFVKNAPAGTAYVSPLLISALRGDADADQVFNLLLPKGLKNLSKEYFNFLSELFDNETIRTVSNEQGHVMSIVWNKQRQSFEYRKVGEKLSLDKLVDLFQSEHFAEAESLAKRIKYIKESAPLSTVLLQSTSTLLEQKPYQSISQKSKFDFINRLAGLIEWGIKQKREAHDPNELFPHLMNLTPINLAELRRKIDSKIIPMDNVLASLQDSVPDDIAKFLQSVNYVKQGSGTNFDYFDFLAHINTKNPKHALFGSYMYRILLGNTGDVNMVTALARAGIETGHLDPNIIGIPGNLPNRRLSDVMGTTAKRVFLDLFGSETGKKIGKVLPWIGGIAGLAAVINFFNPNQNDWMLGHSPGMPRDYDDIVWSRNEMEWKPLMETPLGVLGENAVHIRMDNPKQFIEAYRELGMWKSRVEPKRTPLHLSGKMTNIFEFF